MEVQLLQLFTQLMEQLIIVQVQQLRQLMLHQIQLLLSTVHLFVQAEALN